MNARGMTARGKAALLGADEQVGWVTQAEWSRRWYGLQRHRQASPECFNAWARHPSGARLFPTASNGYCVMLKPPPRGRHTINVGGALPRMSQAVSDTLIVE